VAAVPDGADGMILAWEENRGRKVCCRDTRDIYAQRLDGSGKIMWRPDDVRVATEEAGEEILGVLPDGSGGALFVWRRGGALVVSEIDGQARCGGEFCGKTVLDAGPDSEFYPPDCLAVSPGGTRALVAFAIHAPVDRAGAWVLPLEKGVDGWRPGVPILVNQAALLRGVSVAACGDEGWLLHYWYREGSGAELAVMWLSVSGTPTGRANTIMRSRKNRYINAQAAGSGPGEAFLIIATADPENMGKTHEVRAERLRRGKDGKTRIAETKVCVARSYAMFIPSTLVSIGGVQDQSAATPETVAWRRTEILAPAGNGSILVCAHRPDGFYAHLVSFGGPVTGVKIADKPDPGMPPMIARSSAVSFLAFWSERYEGGARIIAKTVGVRAKGGLAIGAGGVVIDDAGGSPRSADLAISGLGECILAFSDARQAEYALIKAQKLVPGR